MTKRSFIYKDGNYTELLPPGSKSVLAYAINDNEVVVGYVQGSDDIFRSGGFIATPLSPPEK